MNTLKFFGVNIQLGSKPADNYLEALNENNASNFKSTRPGIYYLPYLFEKFLDKDYSRFFAAPKLNYNLENMKKGFFPNRLMSDIDKAELHYQKLNEILKLD